MREIYFKFEIVGYFDNSYEFSKMCVFLLCREVYSLINWSIRYGRDLLIV